MAQPLFDQHPLEQYFRSASKSRRLMCVLTVDGTDTGETAEPMPGGSPDFAAVEESDLEYDVHSSPQDDIRLPELLVRAVQVSLAFFVGPVLCLVHPSALSSAVCFAYRLNTLRGVTPSVWITLLFVSGALMFVAWLRAEMCSPGSDPESDPGSSREGQRAES